jgi:hypothetical protein
MHAPRSAIENKIDASTIFHRYTTEKSDNSDKQRPAQNQWEAGSVRQAQNQSTRVFS